jgi:hypothetical protein
MGSNVRHDTLAPPRSQREGAGGLKPTHSYGIITNMKRSPRTAIALIVCLLFLSGDARIDVIVWRPEKV